MKLRHVVLTIFVLLFVGSLSLSALPAFQSQPPEQQSPPAPPVQQPATSQTPPATNSSSAQPAVTPSKPAAASHKKRKSVVKKRSPGTKTKSGKVVIRNGGAKQDSPQITPAMTPQQAQDKKAKTANLIETTDANLRQIEGRQLAPADQDTVDQIHAYMRQAKAASDLGDITRAYNLAYKAQLLSQELAHK